MARFSTAARPAAEALETGLMMVPVDRLHVSPRNVRQAPVDPVEDEQLQESIRRQGVLEPLVVAVDGEVICGNRRLAKARAAGIEAVPCIIRTFTEQKVLEAMLAENLQRADLNPADEAHAYEQLALLGMEDGDMATVAGVGLARVRERRRLAQLPLEAQTALRDGTLSLEGALLLTQLSGYPEALDAVIEVAKPIEGEQRWTVTPWRVGEAKKRAALESRRKEVLAAAAEKGEKVLEANWDGYSKPKGGKVAVTSGSWVQTTFVVVRSVKEHAKLKCHALVIDRAHAHVHEACTKPAVHEGEVSSAPTTAAPTTAASTGGAGRPSPFDKGTRDRFAAAFAALLAAERSSEGIPSLEAQAVARMEYEYPLILKVDGTVSPRDFLLRWYLETLVDDWRYRDEVSDAEERVLQLLERHGLVLTAEERAAWFPTREQTA